EGGAGPCGPQKAQISAEAQSEVPDLTNAELVQLRVRVIALENLVISLLAEPPDSPARSRGREAAPIQRLSGQELRIALPRKSEPFAGRRVQRRPHCPTSKEPPGAPAKGLTKLVSNPT